LSSARGLERSRLHAELLAVRHAGLGAHGGSKPPTTADYDLVVSDEGVLAAERALQAAQLAGDADALDRLLHPDLLAVGPDGNLADKASDLAAHRAGVFKIHELEQQDLRVVSDGRTAVTFVLVRLRGSAGDQEIAGLVRYTRTWVHGPDGWQVLAAHIAPLPPTMSGP
jgi:ketosteroid isomerase-like protein